MMEEPPDQRLARLDREQRDADQRYQAALTALDRAIQPVPDAPHPPPPYDEGQITPINDAWNILPEGLPAEDRSLKGRLRAFVWRMMGPPLERQKHFNAALVDHLNRNVAAHREAERAIAALILRLNRHASGAVAFQQHLIHFVQTITLFVDSKDRVASARYEATSSALAAAFAQVKEGALLAQQAALALKREVQRLSAPPASGADPVGRPAPAAPSPHAPAELDASVYIGFEDRFRGSREDIRARLLDFVPLFEGATDVLDVGCGRGELLELLRQRGAGARGIDLNGDMVALCREQGLDAERADALAYLLAQPDHSLGGLCAIQVVEHMDPPYLMRFIETAHQKLRPGAPLVLETINVACWLAFFSSYVRDLTHVRPVHPDTLRYLVQASGFSFVEVQYRSPLREVDKLPHVPVPAAARDAALDPLLLSVADVVNAHADRLNDALFTFMDYAVVARA